MFSVFKKEDKSSQSNYVKGEKEKGRAAFTLAEVLITLGIIGVVAAMTIPNLIVSYQKQQTVTSLKQAFSMLSQAIELSEVDNGLIESWDWDSGTTESMTEAYIIPYLSIVNNCKTKATPNACRSTNKYWLNNNTIDGNDAGAYNFVLKNGVQIGTFKFPSGDIFQFMIDINGDKKPNRAGKDVFFARVFPANNTSIYSGKLKNALYFVDPTYSRTVLKDNSDYGCNKTASSNPGIFCGALIQMDGWQIKDDYPW